MAETRGGITSYGKQLALLKWQSNQKLQEMRHTAVLVTLHARALLKEQSFIAATFHVSARYHRNLALMRRLIYLDVGVGIKHAGAV